MTTLRQNFIRELVIRGMSPRTQETYVGAVYRLAKHYRKSPDQISDEELKNYVFHLAKDKHFAASSLNQAVSAFRLFTKRSCNVPWSKCAVRCRVSIEPFVVHRFLASRSWNNSLPWVVPFPNIGRF